jgi:hypothetical protein
MTTKLDIYNFCKRKRTDGYEWNQIHAFAKKDNLIGKNTSIDDLIKVYQNVAGELAAFGKLEQMQFDEHLQQFYNWLGKSRNIEKSKFAKQKTESESTTVVISDVHFPFADEEKLRRIHDEWVGKADSMVILGDLLNGSSLSDHDAHEIEDFRLQLGQARTWIELLASSFDLTVVKDNHVNSRLERRKARGFSPDTQFLVQDPYRLLLAGVDNARYSADTLKTQYNEEFGWLYILGDDCVMAHGEVSGQDMAPARKIQKFANEWKRHLGMKEVRCVIEAHVHKVGMIHDDDCVIGYSGCLVTLDGVKYSMGARAQGGPPKNGYAVVHQVNGRTDLEKTNFYRLV